MAMLQMNVDETRALLGQFKQSCTTVREQADQTLSRTNSVVGSAWIAQSATEFQNEITTWKGKMAQLCQDWETLNNRLNAEIAEWEQMASKLAGG